MEKRLLLLLLALVLVIGMTACGGEEAADTGGEPETVEGETTEAADGEDLGDPNRWIIGLDDTFAPMGFRDDNGELVGFDVDLAKEAGDRMGVDIEFQPIDWKMKENELNAQNIDVIWNGYSVTDERMEKTTLSEPYLSNRQVILVMDDSAIQEPMDLEDKVVAVQEDSGALTAMRNTPELMEIIKDQTCIEFPTNTEAVLDLKAGRTDAVVVDEVFIRFYLRNLEDGDAYRILDEGLQEEEYAVAMRKGDFERKTTLDGVLQEMKDDGTFDEIYSRWFKE